MRVLLVHPSALMYSEIFLRLEPLGLQRVASGLLADGHDVRLIDLQVYRQAELRRQVAAFRPDAVGFSLNYLANVPEVVNLAKWIKVVLADCVVFAGGHSVSFVAGQVLGHANGAIAVVLRGDGETSAPALLAAIPDRALAEVPGAVTADGPGRPPKMLHGLDDHLPARHLGARRRKYFIGVMDPAASIEFTRGTETWLTESRRLTTLDYLLFDVQHAVLPTRLPLDLFYSELVRNQGVLARKHLGAAALAKTTGIVARQLLRRQTNFARMIWKFDKVYNAGRQYAEHLEPVEYQLPPPSEHPVATPDRKELYVHLPMSRR